MKLKFQNYILLPEQGDTFICNFSIPFEEYNKTLDLIDKNQDFKGIEFRELLIEVLKKDIEHLRNKKSKIKNGK